jgi:hypothetical protein
MAPAASMGGMPPNAMGMPLDETVELDPMATRVIPPSMVPAPSMRSIPGRQGSMLPSTGLPSTGALPTGMLPSTGMLNPNAAYATLPPSGYQTLPPHERMSVSPVASGVYSPVATSPQFASTPAIAQETAPEDADSLAGSLQVKNVDNTAMPQELQADEAQLAMEREKARQAAELRELREVAPSNSAAAPSNSAPDLSISKTDSQRLRPFFAESTQQSKGNSPEEAAETGARSGETEGQTLGSVWTERLQADEAQLDREREAAREAAELRAIADSNDAPDPDEGDFVDPKDERIAKLEEEIVRLRRSETQTKSQNEANRKEIMRLAKLRDQDKPPPKAPMRYDLQALEESLVYVACIMMFFFCLLPIMGALALLMDINYRFWMGTFWPWAIILGSVFVFGTFATAVCMLFRNAGPEHRSQFTMFFTWSTFSAFMGVLLIPAALFANRDLAHIAGTVGQGCLSTLPQSELLVDYSQVLYNIRLSPDCTNKGSVEDCNGYKSNQYTDYLYYLENEFFVGHFARRVRHQHVRLFLRTFMQRQCPR